MLTLNLQVTEARDRAAFATLRDSFNTVMTGNAAASATPAIAARQANPSCDPVRLWGHPPLGIYRLLNHRPASHDEMREYGSHLLLFEPESGQALEAESFGRLALLVYAGPADRDRKLRRTQGGVRLTQRMLDTIVTRLQSADDMMLELEALRAPAWWQFWKQPLATEPLSGNQPSALAPPGDEMSLLNGLLQNAVRRVRRRERDDSDDTYDRDRRDDRSSSGRSTDSVQGRGGEFGGAGASGSWGGPGRAPGVDSSGRILGTAAAVGTVAAAAAAAAAAADAAGTGSEGPESTRFEPVPMDSGSGSGGASSESSTATSTAY